MQTTLRYGLLCASHEHWARRIIKVEIVIIVYKGLDHVWEAQTIDFTLHYTSIRVPLLGGMTAQSLGGVLILFCLVEIGVGWYPC